jgi:hypothetical protein
MCRIMLKVGNPQKPKPSGFKGYVISVTQSEIKQTLGTLGQSFCSFIH